MAIAEFKFCPACERSRSDLGMGQACPDCGCPPTDDYIIIRQWRPAADALLVAGAVLFLIAAAGKDLGRWTPATLFALAVILIATRFLVTKRRRRAVLWPEGFALIDWETTPQAFGWSDYTTVRLDERNGSISLLGASGARTEIPTQFFGSKRRSAAFVVATREKLSPKT